MDELPNGDFRVFNEKSLKRVMLKSVGQRLGRTQVRKGLEHFGTLVDRESVGRTILVDQSQHCHHHRLTSLLQQ